VTFPHITTRQILMIMTGFAGLAAVVVIAILARGSGTAAARGASGDEPAELTQAGKASKENWRMPALTMLAPAPMSRARRIGMAGMWVYLAIAMGAVVLRIVEAATGH
jgi:hypothetical protein